MKIVLLAPDVPYPVRHGGRVRAEGLIRCFARFATVRVLAIGDPRSPDAAESRARLAALGVTLDVYRPTGPGPQEARSTDLTRAPDALAHFRSPDLSAALPRVLETFRPDVVHFEELVMAQYASAMTTPRILDRQKVEWVYHDAMAASHAENARWHRDEATRFRRYDASVAGHFAQVLVLGEGDRQALEPLYGHGRVHVVPNGVDDRIQMPAARAPEIRHVLLYGSVDYGPNVEANALYFREVWPALSAVVPALRTLVVGSGTVPPSVPRSDRRVDVKGYVPDIAPVLQGPGVLVVPLRVGGGVRNKILEALAAGMPVVSTAVGAENLGLEAGRHYVRAETAAEIVEAVRKLVADPVLAASLGREGAARVEARYRWDTIGRSLEAVYKSAARSGRPASSTTSQIRALLVGVRPLPGEAEARALSFPGHRTAQFRAALETAGCEVRTVLLDEDTDAPARPDTRAVVLSPEAFRAGTVLQRVHDELDPHAIFAAGGYHPARVVAGLTTDRPRWIDLAGDLAAEGQVRAHRGGDHVLPDYLSVLSRALATGDRFSVVGPSQRLALLGQLGLAGRLTGGMLGEDPVEIVRLAAEGPPSAPPLPEEGFRVLWSGGYNSWMDVDTLFVGLELAMSQEAEIVFVSTGGPIEGHEQDSFQAFWSRVRGSAFASRFRDQGRLSREGALAILGDCHVALSLSRRCLEAALGSRQRLVEALAYGRPVVATALGDLSSDIEQMGAGIVVPAGDPHRFAEALVRLARDRSLLAGSAASARALWQRDYTLDATTVALRSWSQRPHTWPHSILEGGDLAGFAADRLRLQSELDAIRGSYTFRALRLWDRLLRRGR